MKRVIGVFLFAAAAWAGVGAGSSAEAATRIVLIAGRPSHGPGEHEFNAGTKLLVECLKHVEGVEPVFVAGGWPEDESVFDGAKSVVFFMDGGSNHPMIQGKRMETMRGLMDRGVGLVCLHYAVEFPKGPEVGDRLLDWLGGYYETGYSLNPHNDIVVTPKPDHPITRGVEKPFRANDEWYFRIRFRPDDPRVTPILTGANFVGRDGKKYPERQTLAWATERKDSGRGFGFTGAHFHTNWGIPEFRTLVLNAILWSAKLEVPSDGVRCSVSEDDLKKNLDPKPKKAR
jgi:type 1 glutamine amidotransferase